MMEDAVICVGRRVVSAKRIHSRLLVEGLWALAAVCVRLCVRLVRLPHSRVRCPSASCSCCGSAASCGTSWCAEVQHTNTDSAVERERVSL